MGKKRIKAYDRTAENDIRYRGPLTYRHLLVFGWICISFKILYILTTLGISIDANQPDWVYTLSRVSSALGDLALPLFLFANFAIILDKKQTYKQQLIKFGGLSLLVVLLFILAKEHYAVGLVSTVVGDRKMAEEIVEEFILNASVEGKLVFNLFIDLFMCTLLMFFLNYEPRKYFVGKKRYLFRTLALIPILYEVGSLVIRILMAFQVIRPPYIVYPFLTIKPPMSFVLFVLLALHIKFQERRFRKRGMDAKRFAAYTRTNAHSLHFSIYASVMIAITAFIDFVLYILGTTAYMLPAFENAADLTNEAVEAQIIASSPIVLAWGIGQHMLMLEIIPIVLLFSYTRNHNNPKADIYIPAAGAILAFFVTLEGLYQCIAMNLPTLLNMIQAMAVEFMIG